MPIHWTPELNVGIRIIDLQHQELVEMINAIEEMHQDGATIAELKSVLLRLQQYVLFHFSHEEGLMQKLRLPTEHLHHHLEQHQQFAAEVEQAIEAINGEEPPDPARLLHFLTDWLVRHIQGTDKDMAARMRKWQRLTLVIDRNQGTRDASRDLMKHK